MLFRHLPSSRALLSPNIDTEEPQTVDTGQSRRCHIFDTLPDTWAPRSTPKPLSPLGLLPGAFLTPILTPTQFGRAGKPKWCQKSVGRWHPRSAGISMVFSGLCVEMSSGVSKMWHPKNAAVTRVLVA